VNEQARQLRRVRGQILDDVAAFLHARGVGGRFVGTELANHIARTGKAAPESALRVMRSLRAAGYVVENTNRAQSIYEIVALPGPLSPASLPRARAATTDTPAGADAQVGPAGLSTRPAVTPIATAAPACRSNAATAGGGAYQPGLFDAWRWE
jgi:hypothetical protein